MKRRSRIVEASIIAVALWCTAKPAHAQTACPASIAVEQRGVQVPQGWSAGDSGIHPELIGVTIYEGPPEERASLVYDDEKTAAREIVQTWNLPPSARGYWLECRYSNTNVTLRRKLPDSAHHCRVVFERNRAAADGLGVVKTASCGE